MAIRYFRYITAGADLYEGASKIYRNKLYQSPKTNKIYSFVCFMPYCIDGQVQARNAETGKLELLTHKEWFSLIRTMNSSAKKHPKKSAYPPKPEQIPSFLKQKRKEERAQKGSSLEID